MNMFYRKIETKINDYLKDKDAKILIIDGARQIGKSFIIRETASKYFKNYIEIDLKADQEGEKRFANVSSIDSFYLQISALYGDKLGNIEDTIIFLDEIQVYPQLISLFKYLKQDNKYRYIASGSLLGITFKHIFIPMGYIEEMRMFPMDFEEFLLAYNVKEEVIQYLKNCYLNKLKVDENVHQLILYRFKEYLISGGLPAAVKEYIEKKNVFKCRQIQSEIYKYYRDDASQYDLIHKLKTNVIYKNLVFYMGNKVKRINFKKIEGKVNANLIKYENEFDYLVNSGCSIKVKAVANPKFPLVESTSKNLIKLYYNDVGILTNILYKNNINALLGEENVINLGSVYETVSAMELFAHGHDLFYFDSKKVGEVDFLINNYDSLSVIPLEIKSGNTQNNFRAIPKLVKDPYNLKFGYIFDNSNIIKEENNLITMPIYMIMFI